MGKISTSTRLDDVFRQIWNELRLGAESARHPFHTAALATIAPDGPAVRTVVLRHASPGERSLVCHTDLRSPKFAELQASPGVAWLFYDRDKKTQLRMQARALLHHRDALARERWAASSQSSRACYRSELAPGSPLDTQSSTPWAHEGGYANFAVIECGVTSIDWLYLRASGHLRARFTWSDGAWHSAWTAP